VPEEFIRIKEKFISDLGEVKVAVGETMIGEIKTAGRQLG